MRNIERRDDILIYSKKCSVYRVCRVYKMRNIENSRVHFKQIYTMTKSYANTMGFFIPHRISYQLPNQICGTEMNNNNNKLTYEAKLRHKSHSKVHVQS